MLTRVTGKGGKLWIRIFPDRPITNKPAEVGMGKGKRPGRILFELDGVEDAKARDALRRAGAKLPLKTTVITR